jgi:hypothetical protein
MRKLEIFAPDSCTQTKFGASSTSKLSSRSGKKDWKDVYTLIVLGSGTELVLFCRIGKWHSGITFGLIRELSERVIDRRKLQLTVCGPMSKPSQNTSAQALTKPNY